MPLTTIPDPNDVVAGWGPLIGLLLLFVAGVGIFFALRAQLRRVDAANLPSVHDGEDDAPSQHQAAAQDENGDGAAITDLSAPKHVDITKPRN